jgi:eukaryotic-like serine/threonine-protein kinase
MSSKIGKYDLLEVIGKGGMGVVYKAYDPILDREVALKTMTSEALKDPVLRERFYREARSAGKLHHPNIVTIHELGEENDVPYIVMEHLHGTDVHGIIRKKQEIALEKKIRIVVQLCRGLAYAHKSGIVHRDVKPSNVHVLGEDHVKILDFGIARLMTAKSMTTNGLVLGTIHYMSPEQVKATHVDRKSDIFSTGIILYELLTYQKPFDADNSASILYKLVNEPPDRMNPPLDEQFPVLKKVIHKSLDKDPAKRYFTADEMADELEEFLRGYVPIPRTEKAKPAEPVKVAPPPPPSTDPRVVDLIRTSKRLIAQGKAVQALTNLKTALEIDPLDTGAQELKQMVEQDFKRAEVEDLLRRGQEYLKEGRYDIALKAFEKILKINANHSKAKLLVETVKNEIMGPQVEDLLSRARTAYNEKKYPLALKYTEDILVMYPQNREAMEISVALKERISEQEFNELLKSGQRFLDRREMEPAKLAFEKALQIFPQHPVALKRLEEASSAGKIRVVETEKLISLGSRQLELGNLEEARRSFEEVLHSDPHHPDARKAVDEIQEKLRREKVKQLLNEGWREFMLERQFENVIRLASEVLKIDPGNNEAIGLINSARKEMENS